MDNNLKSALIRETREFILEGYGREKKDAYGRAFGSLKKKTYQEIDGLIIHMEPKDVLILEEYEKTKAQKVAGYFKPKQNQDYYVKLKVITLVEYIPV